jgi:hypothetical protein
MNRKWQRRPPGETLRELLLGPRQSFESDKSDNSVLDIASLPSHTHTNF